MAREDLITALKNATDRGETLDAGKISLVTAGYGIEDVEEAAKEVGVHPELSSKAPAPASFAPSPSKMLSRAPSPKPQNVGNVEKAEKTEKEKTGGSKWMNWIIPIFIVVMILLIISLLYNYVLKKPVA